MAAKIPSSFKNALSNRASQTMKSRNGVIVQDEAQARALVQKWQVIVNETLRKTMEEKGYMPGSPVYYTRTGKYPTSTAIGPITAGVQAGVGVASGAVGYTSYERQGYYGHKPTIDIPTMIETGYQVTKKVKYYGPTVTKEGHSASKGRFDFRNIPYFGVRPGVPVRQMVVSALAGRAAAEGVKITLG